MKDLGRFGFLFRLFVVWATVSSPGLADIVFGAGPLPLPGLELGMVGPLMSPLNRQLIVSNKAPQMTVRAQEIVPSSILIKKRIFKNPKVDRALRREPQISVIHISPIDQRSEPQPAFPLPFPSLSPMFRIFSNLGKDLQDQPSKAGKNFVNSQSSNYSMVYKTGDQKPHVSGFISEVESETLPNGKTIVRRYEKPIGDQTTDGARNLHRDGGFPLIDLLNEEQPDGAVRRVRFSRRRRHRRRHRRQVITKQTGPAPVIGIDLTQQPGMNPLAALLAGLNPRPDADQGGAPQDQYRQRSGFRPRLVAPASDGLGQLSANGPRRRIRRAHHHRHVHQHRAELHQFSSNGKRSFRRSKIHHHRHEHRHSFIQNASVPANSTDALSAPQFPVMNDGSERAFGLPMVEAFPLSSLTRQKPDNMISGILANIFSSPQANGQSRPAHDLDEEDGAPKGFPANGQMAFSGGKDNLNDLLHSLLGGNDVEEQDSDDSKNPKEDESSLGEGLEGLLKNILGGNGNEDGDINLDDLLKDEGESKQPQNKIVVPDGGGLEGLLKLLAPNNQDSSEVLDQAQKQGDDSDPGIDQLLASLAKGNAPDLQSPNDECDEPSKDADDNQDIEDAINQALPVQNDPVDSEEDRLAGLRKRLPQMDMNQSIPLMNNFYGIRGIRNNRRPMVFPPLGHKRYPSGGLARKPTVTSYKRYRRRHRHHHRRVTTRVVTGPPRAGDEASPDLLGAALAGMLGGLRPNRKMVKI